MLKVRLFKIYQKYKIIKNRVLNLYIAHEFKHYGKNSSVQLPLYLKGGKYISIGDRFFCGPGFRIEAWDKYGGLTYTPEIQIGNNVSFNYNCHIGAIDKIVISDNVMVGSNVLITDHSHGRLDSSDNDYHTWERPLFSKGPVIIEDNVWLGENVCVLPNVTIGKNSVIGCNSVVNKDIPANVIAAGNPARIIKQLK